MKWDGGGGKNGVRSKTTLTEVFPVPERQGGGLVFHSDLTDTEFKVPLRHEVGLDRNCMGESQGKKLTHKPKDGEGTESFCICLPILLFIHSFTRLLCLPKNMEAFVR